jgi:hypothetical protein
MRSMAPFFFQMAASYEPSAGANVLSPAGESVVSTLVLRPSPLAAYALVLDARNRLLEKRGTGRSSAGGAKACIVEATCCAATMLALRSRMVISSRNWRRRRVMKHFGGVNDDDNNIKPYSTTYLGRIGRYSSCAC